jgi:hypothetical protein
MTKKESEMLSEVHGMLKALIARQDLQEHEVKNLQTRVSVLESKPPKAPTAA